MSDYAFERYTDRARRVIVLAQEEARMLDHDHIGTEHILLGVIHEDGGVAAQALTSLGITLEGARQQAKSLSQQGHLSPGSGHIPFTPRAKKVLELSLREALQLGHNYIGTEHILLGLIREGEGVAAQVLVKLGADLNRVRQQVLQILSRYQGEGSVEGGTPSSSLVLDQFGRNLTQSAREGKLDPVIGREKEIERVMQVLSRRTKNNPVLIGEPGVGKTAVVEGLAQGIVKGEVPETLKDKQLYTLDLGSLVAGSRHRGDVEERLRKVLNEIRTRGDIILIIDDVLAVDPSTARQATADLVAALHAALVQGKARAVLVATDAAFRRAVERDPALARVLQHLPVRPPTTESSVEILKSMRHRFEAHHRVTITDAALDAAVDLVAAHAGPESLPGRAVDLIDEAGARRQMARVGPPPDLREFDEKIASVRRDKESAIDAQNFDRAAHLRDQEKQVFAAKGEREKQWKSGLDVVVEVDEAVIREVAADLFAAAEIAPPRAATTGVQSGGVVNADLFRGEGSLWQIC